MRAVLLSLFIFLSGFLFSQKPEDTVRVQEFSAELLDSLIFVEVNQARLDNDLPKLFYSDSLDQEANMHADQMMQNRKVFYSSSKSKAGECNSKLFFREGNSILTYEELAQSVVQKWLDSPGHAKLLLGEFFLYGGSGVSFTEWKSITEMYVYTSFRISYWE